MTHPQVNVIVPLYNEEQVFEQLIQRLEGVMNSCSMSIEVMLINDGSSDRTEELMIELSAADPRFTSVFLSRNFGHQLALSAGLQHVNATECVFIIDGDLQDPPELLEEFYSWYKKGFDVVYAVRKKRKESWLLKLAYSTYYRTLKRFSNIDIPLDSGDFSLISRRVVEKLKSMPEESRYLRGMRSWVGYKQVGVEYERQGRELGESKYSFGQLLDLAKNGLFNFSEYPIRMLMRLGGLTVLSALVYFGYSLFKKVVHGAVPDGFTALLFLIILFGGMQLIAIGIIGEYILRIFFQVKNRPLFIVDRIVRNSKTEEN